MEGETGGTEVRSREMLLRVFLAMALVLGLVVSTSMAGADEDCYAEKGPKLISPIPVVNAGICRSLSHGTACAMPLIMTSSLHWMKTSTQ